MKLTITQIKENILKGGYPLAQSIPDEVLMADILNDDIFAYKAVDELTEKLQAYWVTDKDLFIFTEEDFKFVLHWHSYCEDSYCWCSKGGINLKSMGTIVGLYTSMFDKYADDWETNIYAYTDEHMEVVL